MASLRVRTLKDGTNTYTVLFRAPDAHGKVRQTSETFDTPAGANEFMRNIDRYGIDVARKILDARADHDEVPTVAEHLEAYVAGRSGLTIGSRRRYEYIVRTITGHKIGALPLTAVTRDDVAGWVNDLADAGLSGKTIQGRQQLLSAAFVYAVDHDLMRKNPARGVRLPRTEATEKVFLTHDEFTKVYDVVDEAWKPLVLTLVGTGMRIGEATALKVSDLHLFDDPPTVTVSRTWTFTAGGPRQTGAPKTERGRRTISLGDNHARVLRAHVEGKAPDDWVFLHDGEPVKQQALDYRWRQWIKKAGIAKKPRLHDLRHTHVSWLLPHVDLTTIQRRLGHSSIKVTSDVYGHLAPDAQIRTARATEVALSGALPELEA